MSEPEPGRGLPSTLNREVQLFSTLAGVAMTDTPHMSPLYRGAIPWWGGIGFTLQLKITKCTRYVHLQHGKRVIMAQHRLLNSFGHYIV